MRLTEKLKGMSAEARRIRESLTLGDPRRSDFNPAFDGMSRYERVMERRNSDEWQSRVAECAMLFRDITKGDRPIWHLKEAMTTSDFPLLLGDLLNRQLLGHYTAYPVSYPGWMRIFDLNDFRTLNLYTIDGGQAVMKTKLGQREPYPEIKFAEGRYQLSVAKYGRRYGITFEMNINDDLNAFNQRPALMAVGARRSEEYLATTMAFDANGPHASFFTSGNANIVTSNPALSTAALQTAYTVLAAQKDKDSEPIVINAVTLVVPPALEITANNIKNAVQLWMTEVGGTANQQLHVNNWFGQRLNIAVNPYIPVVTTSGTKGNTSWMLVADPTDQTQRPAFTFGFLRGRREPQLFVKDSNQSQLGGGEVDPLDGDFETDGIDYKLRHIFGAAQADPKMAVASNGTGS